jgi:hypothetical protein
MGIDDRLHRAAADARSSVAGRRGEEIRTVQRRVAAQRIAAFGLGAVVVLVGVGLAVLANSGTGTELVSPTGDVTTTTALPTTTTVSSTTTSEATETTSPEIANTIAPPGGDGLSDIDSLPSGLTESLGDGSVILLAEHELGIVAAPSVEYPNKWDLSFWDGLRDVVLDFGSDHKPEETPELVVRLLINQDDPVVTVHGVAPLGVYELALPFGNQIPDDPADIEWGEWDESMIVIDEFYQRPEVNRSVFVGTFDKSLLTNASTPIRFETWFTMDDKPDPALGDIFLTFGFQGGRISSSYTGPITTDMFLPPQDLVVDSMTVDSLPTVATCDAPAGVEPPSNQGRVVDDSTVFPTPMGAFEAIMNGELSDSWFPQNGYIELVVPSDQAVVYVKPLTETLDEEVVMLIEIQRVDDGWAVTRWEGSGC